MFPFCLTYTSLIELKIGVVRAPAHGRVLQRTASTFDNAPKESAVTKWALPQGIVHHASRDVDLTMFLQKIVTETFVSTASGRLQAISVSVS